MIQAHLTNPGHLRLELPFLIPANLISMPWQWDRQLCLVRYTSSVTFFLWEVDQEKIGFYFVQYFRKWPANRSDCLTPRFLARMSWSPTCIGWVVVKWKEDNFSWTPCIILVCRLFAVHIRAVEHFYRTFLPNRYLYGISFASPLTEWTLLTNT